MIEKRCLFLCILAVIFGISNGNMDHVQHKHVKHIPMISNGYLVIHQDTLIIYSLVMMIFLLVLALVCQKAKQVNTILRNEAKNSIHNHPGLTRVFSATDTIPKSNINSDLSYIDSNLRPNGGLVKPVDSNTFMDIPVLHYNGGKDSNTSYVSQNTVLSLDILKEDTSAIDPDNHVNLSEAKIDINPNTAMSPNVPKPPMIFPEYKEGSSLQKPIDYAKRLKSTSEGKFKQRTSLDFSTSIPLPASGPPSPNGNNRSSMVNHYVNMAHNMNGVTAVYGEVNRYSPSNDVCVILEEPEPSNSSSGSALYDNYDRDNDSETPGAN